MGIISLSLRGIEYGAGLQAVGAGYLARKLYCYNTIPLRASYPDLMWDHQTIFQTLGEEQELREALADAWHPLGAAADSGQYWLGWMNRDTSLGAISPEARTYKLYISPQAEDHAAVLAAAICALAHFRVFSIKTVCYSRSVARPDKIVAYFDELPELMRASASVSAATEQYQSHGVPFTTPLAGPSMLSWGVDPPRSLKTGSDNPMSWRAWITTRFAEKIVEGRSKYEADAGQYALEQLRLLGLDAVTWNAEKVIF